MNMKKVFMVHGFQGEPNGGWRPWLMGKLAKEDVWACSLNMPRPEAPVKDEWVQEIARMVGEPNESIFLVGHSLGAPAILRYLEGLASGSKVGGVVLVSGPSRKNDNRKIDSFLDTPFNFEHIKNVCDKFGVIHGDNDPLVPFEQATEIAVGLGCSVISIPNGQHLNGSAGWYELPEALETLEKMFQ